MCFQIFKGFLPTMRDSLYFEILNIHFNEFGNFIQLNWMYLHNQDTEELPHLKSFLLPLCSQ